MFICIYVRTIFQIVDCGFETLKSIQCMIVYIAAYLCAAWYVLVTIYSGVYSMFIAGAKVN